MYAGTVDKRKLPIGIQTFRRIREEGFYYVDKTAWARRLVHDAGAHYFLSRPRRFGKSLFVDTLKELFEGSEELFRGLAVHDGWDWSKRHPVVRLDFSSGDFANADELDRNLMQQFDAIEREHGMESGYDTPRGRFLEVLREMHHRTGRRVVVLVDEYDKPILDAIDDLETATLNRRRLRGLLGTIKFADAHVELTFITGVSKFSKVSLFSDLNNLIDLTLNPAYAAVCGYTESDLDSVFAPELHGLDRDAIRAWYNGYHWRGGERVYNPYAILNLFATREFEAHWFETATPRFLIDTLIRRGFAAPDLERVYARAALLSSFDVEAIAPEALLFQTGYLTIVDEQDDDGYRLYRLGYPNREVRRSLNQSLLDTLAPLWQQAHGAVPAPAGPPCAGSWRRATGPAWRLCSGHCWPASRTTGTGATTWPATRGTGRAYSTPSSRRRWTACRWRTPPAAAAWIWRWSHPARRGCSSSRSPNAPRPARR